MLRKILYRISGALLILSLSTPVFAQTESGAMGSLLQTAQAILNDINQFPAYIESITEMAEDWLEPDESDFTATNQATFTLLGQQYMANNQYQNQVQSRLLTDLFNINNSNAVKMPYVNDLTYTTLLGSPILSPDPRTNPPANSGITPAVNLDPAYNYIKNASGLVVPLTPPSNSWSGPTQARTDYTNMYKTLASVQTFNAYVLGGLYAQYKSQNDLTKAGKTNQTQFLIQQATNPNWFTQVASEKLGVVLRQILLFDSQSYVLLSQMQETQKQALAAQAMTNSLLILINQNSNYLLLQRAQGTLK